MDDAVLLLMMTFAAFGYMEPDWNRNEAAAWLQVFALSFSLVFIGIYMVGRSALR